MVTCVHVRASVNPTRECPDPHSLYGPVVTCRRSPDMRGVPPSIRACPDDRARANHTGQSSLPPSRVGFGNTNQSPSSGTLGACSRPNGFSRRSFGLQVTERTRSSVRRRSSGVVRERKNRSRHNAETRAPGKMRGHAQHRVHGELFQPRANVQ